MTKFSLTLILGAVLGGSAARAESVDALKLVTRTEQQSLGKTFQGRLKMTLERPEGARELEILSWTEGRDKAMVKVLRPPKDRGVANLRLEFNLWQYLPNVERVIKVPPSLMLQSWMGSDFTNDDLVKSSRLSRDYNLEFSGFETVNGVKTAKITAHPKPDAPVVWGKLILWIDPAHAVLLQQDFFSENGEALKRLTGSNVRTFGTHTLAGRVKIETLKKKTSTVLEYVEAKFDQPIAASVFTQNFLKAPLREK